MRCLEGDNCTQRICGSPGRDHRDLGYFGTNDNIAAHDGDDCGDRATCNSCDYAGPNDRATRGCATS
jgi:hypothetical protein